MSLYTRTLQVHGAIYERTDGRLGHRLLGVPTILLRTATRRTGRGLTARSRSSSSPRTPRR